MNTGEDERMTTDRATCVGTIGALVGIFALAAFGLAGGLVMKEEIQAAGCAELPAPISSISSETGLVIRSP
jgi:hypothetical protein